MFLPEDVMHSALREARAGLSLELAVLKAGYRFQPVAPVADLNTLAEMPCDYCEAVGHLEPRPYWKGASLRLLARCLSCHHTMEV